MCFLLLKIRQIRSNKMRIVELELEGQIKMEEMCF